MITDGPTPLSMERAWIHSTPTQLTTASALNFRSPISADQLKHFPSTASAAPLIAQSAYPCSENEETFLKLRYSHTIQFSDWWFIENLTTSAKKGAWYPICRNRSVQLYITNHLKALFPSRNSHSPVWLKGIRRNAISYIHSAQKQ